MVITVSLPPFLGRTEAATFRNQLLVALEQRESIAVECAEAGPLPSLWIQLLHSAASSAASAAFRAAAPPMTRCTWLCAKRLDAEGVESDMGVLRFKTP